MGRMGCCWTLTFRRSGLMYSSGRELGMGTWPMMVL